MRTVAKLASKGLPSTQRTTLMALQGMRSEDDVALMRDVVELARWGTPTRFIAEFTGATYGLALRRICEKTFGKSKGGRPVHRLGALFERTDMHLESSVFLSEFAWHQKQLSTPKDFAPTAFIHAYRSLWNGSWAIRNARPVLMPEHAIIAARAYLAGELELEVHHCGLRFLQPSSPMLIHDTVQFAQCPLCEHVLAQTRVKAAERLEKTKA